MIIWCDKPELKITSDIVPLTIVDKPIPGENKETRKHKQKYPYLNLERILWDINHLGMQYCFPIQAGFRWNGTNCLFLQHCPTLLDASMIHDAMCNNHELVGQDRQLSSIIFREVGIASGMWKPFMYGAYHAVDNFQKVWGKDLAGNKWQN